MSNLNKHCETLRDFGLSINQAKVYLALVSLGAATVGHISKVSKVRREDVYRILPRLEKIGLTDRILDTPMKIRAIPLEEGLSILVKLEQESASEKLAALKAKKEAVLSEFKVPAQARSVLEGEEQFTVFSQRDRILNKMLAMIGSAQKEISVVLSEEAFIRFILDHSDSFRKAMRKGIDIRVILELYGYDASVQRVLKKQRLDDSKISRGILSVRYAEHVMSHFIVVDHLEAMASTSKEPHLAENPYLWTANQSLVALIRNNFQEAWNSSVDLKAIQTNAVSEKLEYFISGLRPRDHVILAYQSKEAKHMVLFRYLQVGLEKGEAAIYVASEETPTEIRDAMRRHGIDVERHEKAGALQVLPFDRVYIKDGKFDVQTTMAFWRGMYEESQKKGFKGLRVTGDTAWFLERHLTRELLEYERELHRVLDVPMLAICAYNTQTLSELRNPIDLYTELVRAHGVVLFAGIDNKLGKIEVRTA